MSQNILPPAFIFPGENGSSYHPREKGAAPASIAHKTPSPSTLAIQPNAFEFASPRETLLPACELFLNDHPDILQINERQLQEFVTTYATQEAVGWSTVSKSSPSDVRVSTEPKHLNREEDVTVLGNIARIVAYNVVNFSFFPDPGKERWWIEVDEQDLGEIGHDSANFCVVELSSNQTVEHKPKRTNVSIGRDDEAFAITASLRRWEHQTQNDGTLWADGDYLSRLTLDDLKEIFQPAANAGELPLLEVRLKCLHSLGDCYRNSTSLNELLTQCQRFTTTENGAIPIERLVGLLAYHIPAFRDVRTTNAVSSKQGSYDIEFAKRPQLCASMLAADDLIPVDKDSMNNLTVFSDYRLPQLFLSMGILKLIDTELENSIRRQAFIEAGSKEEIALRAASVLAAERVCQIVNERGAEQGDGAKSSIADIDYFLWRTCVKLDNEDRLSYPFHRTRTFCY